MVRWDFTIQLYEPWQKARKGQATPQQVAQAVADQLTQLQTNHPERMATDPILEDLVFDLGDLAQTHDATFDDLDVIMDRVYNWADYKMVWVNTHTPAPAPAQ